MSSREATTFAAPSWSYRALAAAALLVTGVCAAAVESRHDATESTAAPAPRAAPPRQATTPLAGPAGNGLVEPADREVRIAAPAAGRIAAVRVREGDAVRAGEVLVTLESDDERAAVAAAEAERALAAAEFARARHGARPEDVTAARAEAAAARARARLAERVARRDEALARRELIAQAERERSDDGAEVDRLLARASEARAEALSHGGRREDVAAARARLDLADARLQQARVALARRALTAPSDGHVLAVHHRPGEYVAPSPDAPVVVIGDLRRLRVRLTLDERDVGAVREGARATVTAPSTPERAAAARVERVGARVFASGDATGVRVFEVLLALEPGARFLPGQRVVATVERAEDAR